MVVFWLIISMLIVAMVLLWLYVSKIEQRVKKVYRIVKRKHRSSYDGLLPDSDVAINWIEQIQTMEDIPTKELTEQHIYILLELYQGLYLYATTGSVLHKPIAMPEEKLTRMLVLRACFEKDNSFTFKHNGDTKKFYELLKTFVQENQNFEYTTTQEQNTYNPNDTPDLPHWDIFKTTVYKAFSDLASIPVWGDAEKKEIVAFLLVAADIAIADSPNRKEIFYDIYEKAKVNFGIDDPNWLQNRMDLYGAIYRGEIPVRGELLLSSTESLNNGMLRICAALGDLIYNKECRNNYKHAPLLISGIMDLPPYCEVFLRKIPVRTAQMCTSYKKLGIDGEFSK